MVPVEVANLRRYFKRRGLPRGRRTRSGVSRSASRFGWTATRHARAGSGNDTVAVAGAGRCLRAGRRVWVDYRRSNDLLQSVLVVFRQGMRRSSIGRQGAEAINLAL